MLTGWIPRIHTCADICFCKWVGIKKKSSLLFFFCIYVWEGCAVVCLQITTSKVHGFYFGSSCETQNSCSAVLCITVVYRAGKALLALFSLCKNTRVKMVLEPKRSVRVFGAPLLRKCVGFPDILSTFLLPRPNAFSCQDVNLQAKRHGCWFY